MEDISTLVHVHEMNENAIHKIDHDAISLRPYISTMTICFKTRIEDNGAIINIDIADIIQHNLENINALCGESNQAILISKPVKFKNSIVLGYNNINFKIFSNGMLHLTGAKSLLHAYDCAIELCSIIDIILDIQVSICSFKLQMINLSLKLLHMYNIEQVYTSFIKHFDNHKVHILYDKNRHPGIRFKILKSNINNNCKYITLMFFRTGSVNLVGLQNSNDIDNIHDYLLDIIRLINR